MNKLIYLLVFLAFESRASDLDVLLARTSLALGDEYSKIATNLQENLKALLSENPSLLASTPESELPEAYVYLNNEYTNFKDLALSEYSLVFCESNCLSAIPEDGLELGGEHQFLRREAFTKYDVLSLGAANYGNVGRYATIYAVNSNFEDHLLSKLIKLVENQQRLDEEARKLFSLQNQLQSAYIDNSGELVGIDQQLLREENYTLDTQTQITGYQGCISSETAEDKFEKDELLKSMKQIDILQKNARDHFESIFDVSYQTPGGNALFSVNANEEWQEVDLNFNNSDRVMISATGSWNVRGAVIDFQPSHLYTGSEIVSKIGFFSGIKKAFTAIVSPITDIAFSLVGSLIKPEPRVLEQLSQSNKPAFDKIRSGLDAPPTGYSFSFSESQNAGVSDGSSNSVGVNLFEGMLSLGRSESVGSSSGTGVSTGGAYALKFTTTSEPSFAYGALIGSFCDVDPATNSECDIFLIGNATLEELPESGASSQKLWLRANESSNVSQNIGALQVSVKKQSTFKTYWDEYYDWFNDECDESGSNCGLGYIIENIAYIPNPYVVAKASLVKRFPNFPNEVLDLILQQVNYFIEMKIAARDVKTKELSRELHFTKIANCKDQLKNSQEKISTTKELVATYQRRIQSVETKKILLDTTRNYYDSELAAINNVREKNLERIRRYYALTVSSYNYLYLDNFKVENEPTPYYEGNYYRDQIDIMEDLILEITTINDLLNPNRGYLIHQLTQEELATLVNPDFRQRSLQVKLDYNDFFCQGFNIENQARVMIEKVGVLLDIDPAREHLFFKNPNRRSTQLQITHGLENRFYNFNGNEEEFWMPSQKRNVAGYSTRVLVDANSDYFELRDSRFFERYSFRKTSFATNWNIQMLDPSVRMYEDSDTNFENPLLKGAKLVFWFNSAETQGENPLNQCLIPPYEMNGLVNGSTRPEITWKFPVDDIDYDTIERFTVYRSSTAIHGFKPIGHIKKEDCSIVADDLECVFEDNTSASGTHFYQVKSSYEGRQKLGTFLDGIPSDVVEVTF